MIRWAAVANVLSFPPEPADQNVARRARAAVAIFAVLQSIGPALGFTINFFASPNPLSQNGLPIILLGVSVLMLAWLVIGVSCFAFASNLAARAACVLLMLSVLARLGSSVAVRLSFTPWSLTSVATYTWLTLYVLGTLPSALLVVGAWLALNWSGEAKPSTGSYPRPAPDSFQTPRPVLAIDAPLPPPLPESTPTPVLAYAGRETSTRFARLPASIALGFSSTTCLASLSNIANLFAPIGVGVFSRNFAFYLAHLVGYGLAVALSIASLRSQSARFSVLHDPYTPHAPGPTSLAVVLLLAGVLSSLVSLAQLLSMPVPWQVYVYPLANLISVFAAPALVYLLGAAGGKDRR